MVRGHTIPSIARLTESTAIQDAAATPPPAAISHYTLLTNQGIEDPFAAAGIPANKTPLLRNVALVVRLILLNASVQRNVRDLISLRCRGRPSKQNAIAPQCLSFFARFCLSTASGRGFRGRKKAMLFCIAFLFAESEGFEPPDP